VGVHHDARVLPMLKRVAWHPWVPVAAAILALVVAATLTVAALSSAAGR
jgi:hypothetical protein